MISEPHMIVWAYTTSWKMSKYGVISGPYFPIRINSVFGHFSRSAHLSRPVVVCIMYNVSLVYHIFLRIVKMTHEQKYAQLVSIFFCVLPLLNTPCPKIVAC